MTAPTGDNALREALADVIADRATNVRWDAAVADAYRLADALLPVVLRYGREKAAAVLRAAADHYDDLYHDETVATELRDRADALTATDST